MELRTFGGPYKWLREAILASRVGDATRARRIRLGEDGNGGPDSELQMRDGNVLKVQHVEALGKDRKRGREYSEWQQTAYAPREAPWTTCDLREFSGAIDAVCDKKIANQKDSSIGLLVYANLGGYISDETPFECELAASTRRAADYFPFVWVWWGNRLYRCWPNPFIGEKGAFRPARHVLGQAIATYQSKAILDEIFDADRPSRRT